MSLYDSLGQSAGISTAVDQFYVRVLADPSLAPYFEGTDLDKLREHQTALLTTVTGGPDAYTGRSLLLSHRRLGITDEAFDKVVGHLGATLDALGVAPDVRDQVAAALVAQRSNVVSQPAAV
jgi:hemoglobin